MSRYVGKRVGPAQPSTTPRALLLGLAVAITVLLVGWGLLVLVAVDSGGRVRGGDGGAWVGLAASAGGAVVCLFGVLLLGARVLELLTGPAQRSASPVVPRQPSAPVRESLGPVQGTGQGTERSSDQPTERAG